MSYTDEFTFTVKLRLLEKGDLGTIHNPAVGEIYYLKNSKGQFEGPYALKPGQLTSKEFIGWYKNDMVFIGYHNFDQSKTKKENEN